MFVLPSEVEAAPWPLTAGAAGLALVGVFIARRLMLHLRAGNAPYFAQLQLRALIGAAFAEAPVVLAFVVSIAFADHAFPVIAAAVVLILSLPALRITDATIARIDRRLHAQGIMAGIRHELNR